MDLATIGSRLERKWVEYWTKTEDNRTIKAKRLQEGYVRQAIMNDEEAAWLLKNYPEFKWKAHPRGGLAVVVDGLRYRVTDEQFDASKNTPAASSTKIEMTRREIQNKAKTLGIPANQTNETLLKFISEHEK